MRRYMVFAGESYHPRGGMLDFKGLFSNLDEAIEIMNREAKKAGDHICWGHIYDNVKKEVIKDCSIDNYKG